MSSVWSYADKIKDGIKLSGQCHQCKKIIICSNRSTTTLKDHLKTHGIFITADIEQKKDKIIMKFNHQDKNSNSIPTMISPLIKTKAALFETFAELNSLPIINELDFEALEILEKAMDPIRVTVLALSRQDATLLTADKALNFMISKLEQLNSDISKTLLDNLKKRIDERWNKTLMDLLNCLRDPNNIPSKEVISYAGKLANRLFYNVEADEDVVAEAEVASSEEMSLECELDLILQKDTVNVSKIDNKFKWLKQELLYSKYVKN
ncbi:hypothetical protein PVAND_011944 [Polypedilum vanderplanki]|uniref:BED-type domain-containing protein n=1 Tax=Polypedilum vanderplanki TaxID=319348 RepID=A0A9J6CK39_POLVA|nr:hypothetical protein PVAND_011944 [Polypedilum vanderplanki]